MEKSDFLDFGLHVQELFRAIDFKSKINKIKKIGQNVNENYSKQQKTSLEASNWLILSQN
jgi:hypothetical protein